MLYISIFRIRFLAKIFWLPLCNKRNISFWHSIKCSGLINCCTICPSCKCVILAFGENICEPNFPPCRDSPIFDRHFKSAKFHFVDERISFYSCICYFKSISQRPGIVALTCDRNSGSPYIHIVGIPDGVVCPQSQRTGDSLGLGRAIIGLRGSVHCEHGFGQWNDRWSNFRLQMIGFAHFRPRAMLIFGDITAKGTNLVFIVTCTIKLHHFIELITCLLNISNAFIMTA